MLGLLDGRAVALIEAHEDVFEAGFSADQVDDGMLGRCFDHRVWGAGDGYAQRVPAVQGLYLLYTVQRCEGRGGHALGEGNGDFVVLDASKFGYAADLHEAPFTDDAHALAALLDLTQDVRGQK